MRTQARGIAKLVKEIPNMVNYCSAVIIMFRDDVLSSLFPFTIFHFPFPPSPENNVPQSLSRIVGRSQAKDFVSLLFGTRPRNKGHRSQQNQKAPSSIIVVRLLLRSCLCSLAKKRGLTF